MFHLNSILSKKPLFVNLMVMCVYKFYVHPEVLLVSSCAICKLIVAETTDFTQSLRGVNDYGRHFMEGTAFKLKIENTNNYVEIHIGPMY